MTASFEPHSMDAVRREAAADWLQRLQDKNMSEDDVQGWLQWYGANEANANQQAFNEMQAFYARLRGMNASQRAMLRTLMPEVNAPFRRFASSRNKTFLAAAACCVVVALAFGVWRVVQSRPQVLAYAAPIDHYRTVPLADGSAMVLSARAVANVAYTRETRELEMLQGAAYFQVKRDPRRPFVVRVGEVSITAVGTAFSVKRDAERLSVTVTEGAVDVVRLSTSADTTAAPSENRLRVKTGERTQLTVGPVLAAARPPSSAASSWQDGSMQFFNAPLGQVVEAVNVHARRPILIEDPRVTDLNYSGTVFRERIDEWVAALPQIYPVRSVPLADGAVTLVLRAGE